MPQNTHTITDTQYAHLKDYLVSYRETHDMTFAEMSRLVVMSHGAIANVVHTRKPSLMFVKRLAAGFGVTEDDLLGPAEADVPGDPPPTDPLGIDAGAAYRAHITALETDLNTSPCLELITVVRQCLEELRGLHTLIAERTAPPKSGVPQLF